MPIRSTLNSGDLNRLGDAARAVGLGELLAVVIAGLTPTESSVTVTSNVATLAATPTALFQCNVSAGTTTGVKKLRKGPISGVGALVPAAGECVWDGATKVLFNAVDAATAAHFTYATATAKASVLIKEIEE